MKILMFSLDRTILRDGSGQQKKIIEYLAFAEEIHVVLFSFSGERPLRIHPRVSVYPTSHLFRCNPWYFARAFMLAKKIVRENRFDPKRDVLTAQDSFPTGVAAYLVRRRYGIPLQLQVHIDFFKPRFKYGSLMQSVYFLCARFLLPRADAVRAVSGEIKEYLTGVMGIAPGKIAVLPTFCDVRAIAAAAPRFDFRKKYPERPFLVFEAARFVSQKNLESCIRAMGLLGTDGAGVGLVLVGSGPEEGRLRSMAREGSARSAIFFEPWTDDVVSCCKGADVFLFPSWYEGWGLAVIEAMACGMPVIATAVGCVPMLVEDGKSGYVVAQDDAAAIARHIMALYKNPALRLAMGKAARDSVLGRLPHDKQAYLKEHARALAIASHAT